MVTHRNLELASGVSGVRLAKCQRGDYAVVVLKVHVVENVECIPGDLQEVRMLLLPDPPAFRQPQVNVCVAAAAAGIAPNASGPIIKDRIVIIIVSGGDVVGKARPNIDDPRRLETEPQGIDEHGI